MFRKIPDVFAIVFSLILLAAVATWVLPGGRYDRKRTQVGETTRVVLVQGSYQQIESKPQLWEIFTSPIAGFLRLAEIIAFIFVVGGAFFILNETGAITAGIHKLVTLLKGREYLIIPLVMTLFSLFGAAFGMCEEAMPFALIFVPLALALGYDSIVGISLTFLAAGVGFAGAFLNPFTLQIAQGLAGIEPVSGWGYRLLVWFIVTTFTIGWVMVYAARIKRDPKKSPMYDLDQVRREEILMRTKEIQFTYHHLFGLLILLLGVVVMVLGVTLWNWGIRDVAGLFLAMGLSAGLVAGFGPNELAKSFVAGCKDMVSAALVVGFAGGIIVILEQGRVMDTILHSMAQTTSTMPAVLAADVQYGIQMLVNFFIPSGSAKAALTMPIMAPLADLTGITRQTSVLAYQFGDGFTNMIIPTSGVTVGTLGLAKIPYQRWFRWNYKLQIAFFILSIGLLVWPVMTNWD